MSEEKNKILDDAAGYIKFYIEHNNYAIYKKDIIPSEAGTGLYDEDDVEKKVAQEEKIIVSEKLKVELVHEENELSIPALDTPASEDWMSCSDLVSFANEIKDCPKCTLLARTRKQVVFGTGNPNADVVVVGEAPGADEDEQGKPFIGRAGKLLTDILKAINFTRDEIFICNILKCRPPENRNPLPDEIANCEPYLFKQLEIIKPKLILAVGSFAAQTLLNTKEPLGKLRGKFHAYKGIKMMVTYHPAALLRNPNWKRPTWEDVQLFRKEYDLLKTK